MLWHKQVGPISRQRMRRLVKDDIFRDLDFTDFDTCVDYIKGKITTKVKKSKTDRCTYVLEFIHIDICEPFIPSSMGWLLVSSFMTFLIMIMLSSLVRSLTSQKLLKPLRLKWNVRKERQLRQLILMWVVNIIGDMMRPDVILVHLLDICKIVALMSDTQCQELLNRIGLRIREIACFMTWCDAW